MEIRCHDEDNCSKKGRLEIHVVSFNLQREWTNSLPEDGRKKPPMATQPSSPSLHRYAPKIIRLKTDEPGWVCLIDD